MTEPARLLLLEFLDWVAVTPRRYNEVMEAWRTSCPRPPVWEVAAGRGLVTLDHRPGLAMAETRVALTREGELQRAAHRTAARSALSPAA
jgi:D-3-phosphoglycerate dehydrogenase